MAAADKKNKKVLHTLASDMAKAVSRQQGRAIQMAIQEEKKRSEAERQVSAGKKQNLFMAILSIVLVGVGVGAIYYISTYLSQTAEVYKPASGSLIFTEASKEIDITSLSREKVLSALMIEIRDAKLGIDSAEYIYLTEKSASGKMLVTPARFFSLIGASLPPELQKNLRAGMIGVYKTEAGNRPFMLLRTDIFNETFSGLRAWEKKMVDDFYAFFDIDIYGENKKIFEAPFDDAIIGNINVRVIRNNGENILLYAFLNENNVLVGRDGETLSEVNRRLQSLNISR